MPIVARITKDQNSLSKNDPLIDSTKNANDIRTMIIPNVNGMLDIKNLKNIFISPFLPGQYSIDLVYY